MKKSAKSVSRPLDKALFEAGQQCQKRLYLDHQGKARSPELPDSRRALSEIGRHLFGLACKAFPRGTEVKGEGAAAAAETASLLAAGSPVLFGATFLHDDVLVRSDILIRNKDGACDLYEVKSGTKVKPRYVTDLALQVHVMETAGTKVRKANILHLNGRYAHTEGEDYPVQKLFKSADVTARARRHLPQIAGQITTFRGQMTDRASLAVATGSWCTAPFPCPHLPTCSADEPEHALRRLPDLTRDQEAALLAEGIRTIDQIDPRRAGLTFRQRRLVQSLLQQETLVEVFVREELRDVNYPVHCIAVAARTEVLPRFTGQRPWRQMPYAWFGHTMHADGTVVESSFVHLEREDPRRPFVTSLAALLKSGGTVVTAGHDAFDLTRALLEDLKSDKAAVRSVLARPNLDLTRLLESGVFHPGLIGNSDLAAMARALLADAGADQLALADDDAAFAAIEKAITPRVRASTREKLAADLLERVRWQSRALLQLFRVHARGEPVATADTRIGDAAAIGTDGDDAAKAPAKPAARPRAARARKTASDKGDAGATSGKRKPGRRKG